MKTSLKSIIHLALLLAFAISINGKALSKQMIPVGVFEEHYPLLQSAMESYGCRFDMHRLDPSNQMLMELALLCEALKQDTNYHIELLAFPLHRRILQQLETGGIALSGMTIQDHQAKPSAFRLAEPNIRSGEFAKGLYYWSGNKKFSGRSIKEVNLQKLLGVINTNWKTDLQGLTCSGITVYHVDRYEAMFKLLVKGRADVFPHTFTSQPNMALYRNDTVYYPIPNIRIAFKESWHYFVSKAYPESQPLFQALQKGLRKIRAEGKIDLAYQKLGILRTETASWRDVNCEP